MRIKYKNINEHKVKINENSIMIKIIPITSLECIKQSEQWSGDRSERKMC